MPVKQFTRVTACAAGLLLTELVPTNGAQSTDLPQDPGDDAVPVTSESSRERLAYVDRAASEPTQMAQPERLPAIVSAAPLQFSDRSATQTAQLNRSEAISPISKPETLPITKPEVISSQEKAVTTSALVADLRKPKTVVEVQPTSVPSIRVQPVDANDPKPRSPASANATPRSTVVRPKDVAVSTRASDLIQPASTQAESTAQLPTQMVAQATQPNTVTSAPIILPRVGAQITVGDAGGFSNFLGGVNGFVPLAQKPGQSITFAEGRVLLSAEKGNPSANLIVGHRIYDQKSDRMYAGYLAYDHRSTGNNGFNQLGFGVETLGKTWDVRANAYLPVGSTRQLVAETINSSATFSNPFFQQNFLATTRTLQQQINQKFEAAVGGFDLEAGGKLAKLGVTGELRGYGGVYYLKAPESDGAVGVRARLEARITDTIQAGLVVSTDRLFGTNAALSVGVTLPTTRPRRDTLKEPFLARLGDSIYRNPTIAIEEQKESKTVVTQETQLVTNPATGQPWRFRHANPGIGTGDGTFENPTGTVAQALAVAQPDDIVYVQPGTNPGIPAFTIPDRVQVLSTGPIQRIDTVELGNLQLPGSGAGVLPTVQGTVTLGNSTTLSGFAIGTTTGPGILGNNISNAIVRDNAIANTAGEGILLNNVQGQVTIQDNTIRQAGGEGISLNNNQGQVNMLLTRNQIANNGATAVDGDGVNVELRNSATGNFTITNNTITDNSGTAGIADGIDVKLFNAANGTFNVADNTIAGNQLNGVAIDLEATARGTFNFTRNAISGNQASGVAVLASDDATGAFNFDSSTIANNQLKGAQFVFSDRASGTVNLTNSTVTGNQDDGFFLQTSDQARATAQLLNNTIANNTRYGVFTTANDTSQLRILTDANTITGNGFAGVSINTFDAASSAAALRLSTITGNTFSDVEAFTTGAGATACLQPLNNTIGSLFLDDSFGGAISVEAGALPTNTITTSDLTFWSGTTVAPGTCGF
ncbi:MAG: right-handed parallel beta-helix repeat-containing protein [Leptolyngbyaceae cyanobacterium bins.302]|nr:right-handed parallel beta-helix repeat-containing protein [Leptolyngbyaceae cyanobacterium bins.302]